MVNYILDRYTEEAGPGAPLSLAVSAEDTDGRYLVGTYAINFHRTYENWEPFNNYAALDHPYEAYSSGSLTVKAGDEVYYKKEHPVDVDVGAGLQTVSLIIGASPAVAYIVGGSSVLTGPLGFAVAGTLAAVGETAAIIVGSPPSIPPGHKVASYDQFKDSVDRQLANPTENIFIPPPGHTVQEIKDQFSVLNPDGSPKNPDGSDDMFFNGFYGTMMGTATVGTHMNTHVFKVDYYGANGYNCVQYPSGTTPGLDYATFTWACDTGTPNT